MAWFERALVALQHLPERRDLCEQAIDLRFDLRGALTPLGEFGRVFDYLREAESLAETLDDQRRLGRVSAYRGAYYSWQGDREHAIASGQRTLAIAVRLGDPALQVMANYYLGMAYQIPGDYRRAIDFLMKNVLFLQGDLLHEFFGVASLPAIGSRVWLVDCLAELGAFAEGIARGEEAIQMAEAVDHFNSSILAYWGLGAVYLRQGHLPRALPMLERALERCQAANLRWWLPWAAMGLGSAYALSGRLTAALPLLEQAVEHASAMGMMGSQSLRVTRLGEAYLDAGRLEDARTCALQALELAQTHKEPGHQAWTLRLLGEVAAQCNPPEVREAETFYRQSLALADELGMRPLLAHCHFGLGTLYRQLGQQEQARAALSTAVDLFQSMGMTFWLPRAEALLPHSS